MNRARSERASAATAAGALVRCAGRCIELIARRRLHQPAVHVGRSISFTDGSSSSVYRETIADVATVSEPCVLVVCFRLRWVRREAVHRLFRIESLLNTILFAGFPGFVSKLWMRHDQNGRYRGIYQWDGSAAAQGYVQSLWWALATVSELDSIDWVVIEGAERDAWLAGTKAAASNAVADASAWWPVRRPSVTERSGNQWRHPPAR